MLIHQDRFPIKHIITIGILPGFIKKIIYRLKGYSIGKKVILGFGSVICGENVNIGDHTRIGFFTIIRGKNIKIGAFVNIGAATILEVPNLEIGDGSKINEQVFVGGLQFPDSKFVMGKNCQIMQMSFINPTKSITIGDDSGIGGDCLLFGHNSWLSQFEGYPVEFEPIEIGKSVSISWRVFVLAGSKIGDGAVIGANSLVHRTVPPRCLAVGYPAKVVNRYPDFPKEVTDDEKLSMLHNIVDEMMKFFSDSGLKCENTDSNTYVVTQNHRTLLGRKSKDWKMKVFYDDIAENEQFLSENLNLFVSLRTIPKRIRKKFNDSKVMWIDIEKKEQPLFWNNFGEEVVLFLRRYGVRFLRVDV